MFHLITLINIYIVVLNKKLARGSLFKIVYNSMSVTVHKYK